MLACFAAGIIPKHQYIIEPMNLTLTTTREDHLIAWLTALAVTIHVLESTLPTPLPGIKPGLANIITIVVLMRYGIKTAIWVSLLRVLIGSLVLGTFLSPTFVLSLTGAIASVVVLVVLSKLNTILSFISFGAVSYAVFAACAHMAGQFYMAYLLFLPHAAMFKLLPLFMTAGVLTGILTGVIAGRLLNRITDPTCQ